MFYQQLYEELGKLFYTIAAVDGKVAQTEKKTLQDLIESTWKPLEGSTDKYGTDQANLIGFAFDYEDTEGITEDGFESFERFYFENKSRITPDIVNNIIQTAKAIASASRARNKSENEIISKVVALFEN